jgi:predicted NUDIX family NTP pyrophosphohydrolase
MGDDDLVPSRRSAGLLVFRRPPDESLDGSSDGSSDGLEVFLGHMGGPFWARKDERAWSVPKGEHDASEDPLAAARREFVEETGLPVPTGPLLDLGQARQPSGKVVTVWAVEGDVDAAAAVSNTFPLEWPPRSGRFLDVPELDRFAWVDVSTARGLLVAGQVAFLDRLVAALTL